MPRPVILLGQGIRRNPALVEHLGSLGIPVLLSWMAADLLPENHPAFCGRPGIRGQRAANIIIQKASHLYVFGARLDECSIGFAGFEAFAPAAQIEVFDCDPDELMKLPERYIGYLRDLSTEIPFRASANPDWLAWCKALYERFRAELDGSHADAPYIDPHAFTSALSDWCKPDDVLAVASSGAAAEVFLQAFRVKQGQVLRFISTLGAMGAEIPMAIGGCIASGRRRTICAAGEGGFQLNVQELETVRRLNLPITFFVWNNGGYGSIRIMQDARFGRRLGCDAASGFTTPALRKIARCYELPFYLLSTPREIFDLPDEKGPRIVEVPIDPAWQQYPRVMSSLVGGKWSPDRLEDMTPKLDPAELAQLMEWGYGQ